MKSRITVLASDSRTQCT